MKPFRIGNSESGLREEIDALNSACDSHDKVIAAQKRDLKLLRERNEELQHKNDLLIDCLQQMQAAALDLVTKLEGKR